MLTKGKGNANFDKRNSETKINSWKFDKKNLKKIFTKGLLKKKFTEGNLKKC